MALRLHPLENLALHAVRAPMPASGKSPFSVYKPTAAAVSAAPATSTQTAQGPSFTAVFAQIAAAAAAADTSKPAAAAPAISAQATTSAPATSGPAGPLFGANPWMTDPTGQGPNGVVTHYNPIYFATQQTAQTVASMIGGKVVQSVQITTAPGSPFQQDQSNYMVQLPNGGMVNPGFIADIYTHGWNQSFIDQQVAAEVAGAQPSPLAT